MDRLKDKVRSNDEIREFIRSGSRPGKDRQLSTSWSRSGSWPDAKVGIAAELVRDDRALSLNTSALAKILLKEGGGRRRSPALQSSALPTR